MQYRLTINGKNEGTIHSESFDAALKSAMLVLELNHVVDAQIASAELNKQMIYYSIWFDSQGTFQYEWREAHTYIWPYNKSDGLHVLRKYNPNRCDASGSPEHSMCFRKAEVTVYADDAEGYSVPVAQLCRKHANTEEDEINYHEGRRLKDGSIII